MIPAYKTLVERALAAGLVISVFDGEEWAVNRSTNEKDIGDAIESVEEAQLTFRDAEGKHAGWALIIPFDDYPDETVVDHTDNELMNALTAGVEP